MGRPSLSTSILLYFPHPSLPVGPGPSRGAWQPCLPGPAHGLSLMGQESSGKRVRLSLALPGFLPVLPPFPVPTWFPHGFQCGLSIWCVLALLWTSLDPHTPCSHRGPLPVSALNKQQKATQSGSVVRGTRSLLQHAVQWGALP